MGTRITAHDRADSVDPVMAPPIYLASLSPRRTELLNQVGVTHEVVKVSVDEERLPGEAPEDYVLRLASAKARAGRRLLPAGRARRVLAADTAVVLDDLIMGKPCNREDALRMMGLLSGRGHRVCTGVVLLDEREHSRLSISEVRFRGIRPAEARAYWDSGEPVDKAGGYAIQGLGAMFIAELKGSFSGVMGLPLYETVELLQESGIKVLV